MVRYTCFVYRLYPVFVLLMKRIKLSKRLIALAELIGEDASVADIGTDHGYLPVYLAQEGTAKRIVASDISAASLATARRSAEEFDVSEAITFLVAPGLDGVAPNEVDTIVIAGMGGETILSILEHAPWTKDYGVTLVLQPQSKIDLLCRFLYDNGYEIKETKSVHEKGKYYTIILALGE